MKRILSLICLGSLLFASCINIKKYQTEMELFQKGLDTSISKYTYRDLKIKAGDILSVNLYTQASINQDQTLVLNMGGVAKSPGTYVVNNEGQIDFPRIGLLKVEGLTVKEIKAILQSKWGPLVKDLNVNVQLQGFTINILGEFKNPGAKLITTEKVTLMDAFSLAGGLTDDGKRNDILVIREELGQRKTFRVDFRDAALYNSPVFQLQQNDIIYAGMNENKFRQRGYAEFNQKVSPVMTFMGFFNFILGVSILIATLSK